MNDNQILDTIERISLYLQECYEVNDNTAYGDIRELVASAVQRLQEPVTLNIIRFILPMLGVSNGPAPEEN
jgi:hypothetical protein